MGTKLLSPTRINDTELSRQLPEASDLKNAPPVES